MIKVKAHYRKGKRVKAHLRKPKGRRLMLNKDITAKANPSRIKSRTGAMDARIKVEKSIERNKAKKAGSKRLGYDHPKRKKMRQAINARAFSTVPAFAQPRRRKGIND